MKTLRNSAGEKLFSRAGRVLAKEVEISPPPSLPTNDEGWTDWSDISVGGTTYYVSSSGSDSNNGKSEGAPFKTIAHGIQQMAGGDRLLLKRGDVFTSTGGGGVNGNFWRNGTDATHHTVFGYYGSLDDARPVIQVTSAGGSGWVMQGGGDTEEVHFLAFIGWHFTHAARNPNSEHFNASGVATIQGGDGLRLMRQGQSLLIEDCVFEWFPLGLQLRSEGDEFNGIRVRRCLILDCWNNQTVGHSSGIFVSYKAHNVLFEECLVDHNGWCEHPNAPNSYATIFNHNFYVQYDSNPHGLEIKNCLIARGASHGFQCRAGGKVTGNILVQNAIAGFIANDYWGPFGKWTGFEIDLSRNVVVDARVDTNNLPRGWGLELIQGFGSGTGGGTTGNFPTQVFVRDNLLVHCASNSENSNGARDLVIDSDYNPYLIKTGNISYEFAGVNDPSGVSYVDSTRTLASYSASLGFAASSAAFLAEARLQRRGNWRPQLTAQAVREYFEEGYSPD